MASPPPLLLNGNSIQDPQLDGSVHIKHNKTIELFCSDKFTNSDFASKKLLLATCIGGIYFDIDDDAKKTPYDISSLACTNHVKSTVKSVAVNGQTTQHGKVGFEITAKRFIQVYDVTFDPTALSALYSNYRMTSAIKEGQSLEARIPFRKEGLYNCDCDNLYKKEVHREAICSQLLRLSTLMCNELFGGQQKYLARGHLAASSDFVYTFQQRSTYNFCNAAPQWQSINNGHWKTLEFGVREFVTSKRLRVDILVGTYGIMEWPNSAGIKTKLFLDDSRRLPVPKYFYKIVIDPVSAKGVVFVSVNNPYVRNEADIKANYTLCTDVSESLTWPRVMWFVKKKKAQRINRDNTEYISKGYMYACTIHDFINVVTDLPAAIINLVNKSNDILN